MTFHRSARKKRPWSNTLKNCCLSNVKLAAVIYSVGIRKKAKSQSLRQLLSEFVTQQLTFKNMTTHLAVTDAINSIINIDIICYVELIENYKTPAYIFFYVKYSLYSFVYP